MSFQPLMIRLSFLILVVLVIFPNFAFAGSSCSVEPFSQSVIQGEQAVYTVRLNIGTTTVKKYGLRTGNLPNNVIRGFLQPTFSDLLPKDINLAFETNSRSQLGPISMAVFFTTDDGTIKQEAKCLFELVIRKKSSENTYLMQTKARVNMKNTVIEVGDTKINIVQTETNTPLSIKTIQRLRIGSRGDEVLTLQRALLKSRYLQGEDMATGYFGVMTRNALKLFQIDNGLEPIGEVGPKTREVLNKLK